MSTPETYAKLTELLCAILLNQKELAHMIRLSDVRQPYTESALKDANERIKQNVQKALKPIGTPP